MKVAVSDVQTRKAFDIVNIFHTLGVEVELFSKKSFLHRVVLSLIYRQRVKKELPSDVALLPTEDSTIRELLESGEDKRVLLPPKESFELAFDKGRFCKFCEENGFDTPKVFSYKEIVTKEKLPCKLIIKPKVGSGAEGIKFVDSMDEFLALELDWSKFLIQQRLEDSVGVEGGFFLCHDGEVVSFYSHKRLKTYPRRGGVTIHSVSTKNHEIEKLGGAMLKKLNWSGFAMIEFIYDDTEKSYKAIELNPRVWGSIMLSEFCGVNMLYDYVCLVEGKSIKPSKVLEQKAIRWLIPWDVGYLSKNLFNLDKKETCYINFSYASVYMAVLFLLYNTLNPAIFKKLVKKMFS